jgi:hypothetical protein
VEEHGNLAREQRLLELRREAELRGEVKSGIRPRGAPFPVASRRPATTDSSAKTAFLDVEIPLYFFVGGAAGATAVERLPTTPERTESWCVTRDGSRQQAP